MVRVSRAEMDRIRRLAAAKKAKRKAKAKEIGTYQPNRGDLKDRIVRLLGLLDRKINGAICRLGHECPAYSKIGLHTGEVAYHLIPQKRGDAARFLRENVVWACHAANFGEVNNRDLYREKHITIFGQERIEGIEAISRMTADYSMEDLKEMEKTVKAELGALP